MGTVKIVTDINNSHYVSVKAICSDNGVLEHLRNSQSTTRAEAVELAYTYANALLSWYR